MDPNATLEAIFDSDNPQDATEYCEYLADWLRKGGFAPTVKKGRKYWPGTRTDYAILSPAGSAFEGLEVNKWYFVRYNFSGVRTDSWALNHE
jgi:hypothetical protein